MRELQRVLSDDYGLDLEGWTLTDVAGISDDGLTIAGTGLNPNGAFEGWIAIIPEPVTAVLVGTGLAGLGIGRRAKLVGCGSRPLFFISLRQPQGGSRSLRGSSSPVLRSRGPTDKIEQLSDTDKKGMRVVHRVRGRQGPALFRTRPRIWRRSELHAAGRRGGHDARKAADWVSVDAFPSTRRRYCRGPPTIEASERKKSRLRCSLPTDGRRRQPGSCTAAVGA